MADYGLRPRLDVLRETSGLNAILRQSADELEQLRVRRSSERLAGLGLCGSLRVQHLRKHDEQVVQVVDERLVACRSELEEELEQHAVRLVVLLEGQSRDDRREHLVDGDRTLVLEHEPGNSTTSIVARSKCLLLVVCHVEEALERSEDLAELRREVGRGCLNEAASKEGSIALDFGVFVGQTSHSKFEQLRGVRSDGRAHSLGDLCKSADGGRTLGRSPRWVLRVDKSTCQPQNSTSAAGVGMTHIVLRHLWVERSESLAKLAPERLCESGNEVTRGANEQSIVLGLLCWLLLGRWLVVLVSIGIELAGRLLLEDLQNEVADGVEV